MPARKKTAKAQVPLRIVETLRARLEKSAKSRSVSMNAEIIERLERSYEIEDRLGGPQLIVLMETIAAVMKSTGERAGFYETGKLTNWGEWLALPYSFDQATKAAITILEHHRPPGKIVVPKPNVVEVIGVRGTKVDLKESAARVAQLFAELGPLIAASKLRDREDGK